MPANATVIRSGNGRVRSKERLLTRQALDGRTKARKQADRIASGIAADLGGDGNLSTIEKVLIEAFAGSAITVFDLNARLMLGQKVDLDQHATQVSSLVRIAGRLGLKRRPRDITPSLAQYLEAEPAE